MDNGDYPLQCTLRLATYYASRRDWEAVANSLERVGEKRLANAIRSGLERRPSYWDYIGLRFRNGSIPKLDRYVYGSKV